MKKLLRNLFTALLLFGLAFGLLGMALDWWETVFFPGWWTVFLFVPAIYGFINDGFNLFNSLLFLIGAALLMPYYFESVTFKTTMYIVGAVLLIFIALRIIFSPYIRKRKRERFRARVNIDMDKNSNTVNGAADPEANYSANFSSKTVDFDNREFNGAALDVSFGSIKLDLRRAVISHDADVVVSARFGGVEILLPDNVGAVDKCDSTFGGVDIKGRVRDVSTQYPKIIISGDCSFGGIDVK